jgi:hypothetical protein
LFDLFEPYDDAGLRNVKFLNSSVYCEVGTSILHNSDLNELQDSKVQRIISYEYKTLFQNIIALSFSQVTK